MLHIDIIAEIHLSCMDDDWPETLRLIDIVRILVIIFIRDNILLCIAVWHLVINYEYNNNIT